MNGGDGNPLGRGLLCVGGATRRSQVQVTQGSFSGYTAFLDFRGEPLGSAIAGVGTPTYYQFWYREPQNGCGEFNFSNAWGVTWEG